VIQSKIECLSIRYLSSLLNPSAFVIRVLESEKTCFVSIAFHRWIHRLPPADFLRFFPLDGEVRSSVVRGEFDILFPSLQEVLLTLACRSSISRASSVLSRLHTPHLNCPLSPRPSPFEFLDISPLRISQSMRMKAGSSLSLFFLLSS